MILYHGTNENFSDIDLGKSRTGKDFGIGFYLTPDKDIARRQAERKYKQYGSGSVNVIEYEHDEQMAEHLKTLQFSHYSIEWAKFILLNRKNQSRKQVHDHDIVIGPIADDTVGFQIRRLEDGIINMNQFLEEIKFHHVTIQYFFANEKAINTLKRL